MLDRSFSRAVLLLAPLLLAACGGGREAQSDGSADGVQVNTSRTRPGALASGGATATPANGTSPAPAAAGRQDANEILRRVEQTAAGIRTLEADFVQNLHVPL